MCIYSTIGLYSGIILLFSCMQCMLYVHSLRGLYILMRLKDETGLYASGYPSFCLPPSLPHRHPQQTKRTSVYPQQSGAFQQHRAPLRHIYISIHRGLTVFNSTSLRQSFTGCAIHDRLCTEYELRIMQNIHKHQGYSWVNSD